MTSLSALDKGVAWGGARAALRGQGIRGSSGLSHFVPGLWFVQAPSGFGSAVLQGSFEDHVFFFLFFRFQELDERRFAHFLPLVLEGDGSWRRCRGRPRAVR